MNASGQEISSGRESIGVGTQLGRYRLMERIGQGGMGEVWRAHDVNLDRDVAIKMLLQGALGDTKSRERFRREALVLSRLSHPGVATIFDFDVQDGCELTLRSRAAVNRRSSTSDWRCFSPVERPQGGLLNPA